MSIGKIFSLVTTPKTSKSQFYIKRQFYLTLKTRCIIVVGGTSNGTERTAYDLDAGTLLEVLAANERQRIEGSEITPFQRGIQSLHRQCVFSGGLYDGPSAASAICREVRPR